MQVDGQTQVSVTYEPLHLIDILRRDLLAMNVMCEQGGMFEDRIYNRSKAVFEYFGLPFDQQEP